MRMGAELAFGALMLLVLVVLGSVTCACRQRALRRRKDRERWRLLLAQHAHAQESSPGLRDPNDLTQPLLTSSAPCAARALGDVATPALLDEAQDGAEDEEAGAGALGSLLRAAIPSRARSASRRTRAAVTAAARAAYSAAITVAYGEEPAGGQDVTDVEEATAMCRPGQSAAEISRHPPDAAVRGASAVGSRAAVGGSSTMLRNALAGLRHEVAAAAAKQRAAVESSWWSVVVTWLLAAAAVGVHALLAVRLGLLDLDFDSSPADSSPLLEDIALILVWAAPAAPARPFGTHARAVGTASGDTGERAGVGMASGGGVDSATPVLAIPLPSPSLDDLLSWDLQPRLLAYSLALCALLPLGSLLVLLVALPWTPPDLEHRGWLAVRRRALAAAEAVGIWPLLPLCMLLILAATVQVSMLLPVDDLLAGQRSALHVELSLGCSITVPTLQRPNL